MIKQKSNLQFQESERRPRGKNIYVSIYMKFDSFYFENIFMTLLYNQVLSNKGMQYMLRTAIFLKFIIINLTVNLLQPLTKDAVDSISKSEGTQQTT